MNDKYFSGDTVIRYGPNDTITYIKGNNLSSSLDNDSSFITLKNNDQYIKIAYTFLQHYNKLFKLDNPRIEFIVIDTKVDDLNYKHIKFQQVIENIPIWQREFSIHLNNNNQIYLAQGHYEPTLKNVSTVANISEQTAIRILKDADSGEKIDWEVTNTEKIIFMIDDKTPRLSYKITLIKGVSGRETYFVDAKDGKILHTISEIHTR